MNRQEKEACIASVRQAAADSTALFVVGIQGLAVDELQGLRRVVREQRAALRVVKNTLSNRALEGIAGARDLHPYLRQQVAIVFAYENPSGVAKLLCERAENIEKFSIVAGCVDERVIDAAMVKFLGSLPPYEVVLAQACGALKQPLVAHVSVLKQVLTKFVWVLKHVQQQKEGGGEQITT